MIDKDNSFSVKNGLEQAISLLRHPPTNSLLLPSTCPESGIGEFDTLELLAPHVLGRATLLDSPMAFAHMDPPTPWITWATILWNARLNQNLLHPATAPFAIKAEKLVIDWLTPFFGMNGGHMCPGSTLANLTALWAARDTKGIKKVVASSASHLSIKKAARILGLIYEEIPTNERHQINSAQLGDISEACLVLTAGTTSTGAIDPLKLIGQAPWTHVDAAWAGPLCLSDTYSHLLKGIENADSIAVSAHKWLFQPKESALIMFRDTKCANNAISFGGSYLTTPNIGLQGSHGATAIPLLATLIAWGKKGIVDRIEHTMSMAKQLAEDLCNEKNMQVWAMPKTGVTVFRPLICTTDEFYKKLPDGMFSTCVIEKENWIRSVSANPLADINEILTIVREISCKINA
jgi:L-2,4-diaminobutyrate decarboxylase